MRVFGLFIFALMLALASANKKSSCRKPQIFQNFDIKRILGTWYENSRYRHDFEEGCECFTTEISAVDDNTISFINCCQMLSFSTDTQNCKVAMKNAYLTNPELKEANFNYTRFGSDVESSVWIVDTDYDNYMIASGCDQVSDNEEKETFWVMLRQKEITGVVVNIVNGILKNRNFEESKIFKQNHGIDFCTFKLPVELPIKLPTLPIIG